MRIVRFSAEHSRRKFKSPDSNQTHPRTDLRCALPLLGSLCAGAAVPSSSDVPDDSRRPAQGGPLSPRWHASDFHAGSITVAHSQIGMLQCSTAVCSLFRKDRGRLPLQSLGSDASCTPVYLEPKPKCGHTQSGDLFAVCSGVLREDTHASVVRVHEIDTNGWASHTAPQGRAPGAHPARVIAMSRGTESQSKIGRSASSRTRTSLRPDAETRSDGAAASPCFRAASASACCPSAMDGVLQG